MNDPGSGAVLRSRLSMLNREFARSRSLLHVESYGDPPVIVYGPDEHGLMHGNFHPSSYAAICACSAWFRRLNKPHSQAKRCLPRADRRWMELDSSVSSDALLMNVFCYPGVTENFAVRSMLGLDKVERPQFGFRAKVPLLSGNADRTEVDMKIGDLLVESKLTESDFQSRETSIVERYRDFRSVFDTKLLPRRHDRYLSYQLIRNVLAAYALEMSVCVFIDGSRRDLLEHWYGIIRSIRIAELKVRCKVLTWQELSAALPQDLQDFLCGKYGIASDPFAPLLPIPDED